MIFPAGGKCWACCVCILAGARIILALPGLRNVLNESWALVTVWGLFCGWDPPSTHWCMSLMSLCSKIELAPLRTFFVCSGVGLAFEAVLAGRMTLAAVPECVPVPVAPCVQSQFFSALVDPQAG